MSGPTLSGGITIGGRFEIKLSDVTVSGAATDPYFSSVSLLASFEGANNATTFTDSSSNAHTLTAVSGAKLTTTAAPTGQTSCLTLNGSSDFVTLPDHASFEFGSGDFSIEMWVKFATVAGGTFGSILSKRTNSGTNTGFSLFRNVTDLQTYMSSTGVGMDMISGTSLDAACSAGTWIAYYFGRSGSTFYKGKDGVVSTLTTNASAMINNTDLLRIGGEADNYRHNGQIGPVRITKGVCRYTANYTVPTLPLPTA